MCQQTFRKDTRSRPIVVVGIVGPVRVELDLADHQRLDAADQVAVRGLKVHQRAVADRVVDGDALPFEPFAQQPLSFGERGLDVGATTLPAVDLQRAAADLALDGDAAPPHHRVCFEAQVLAVLAAREGADAVAAAAGDDRLLRTGRRGREQRERDADDAEPPHAAAA